MFGTGAFPGADRFLDRRRVGRASGHIARSRPTGAGRGRSCCILYHDPRPAAIHSSQGRSGEGRTPAAEAGSRPMSRCEDAPRDLLFGLIARSDPESIGFGVVGPTRAISNGPSAGHLAVHLLRHVLGAPPTSARAGRHAPPSEAPRRRRARGGTPRGEPDSGAARCRRPSQRLPRRAAVQGGHRAAAARLRHHASSGPRSSCEANCPWRTSPPAPASRPRARSPATPSASWAARRGGSGRPQESPNRPLVPPRNGRATPLPLPRIGLRRRGRAAGEGGWTSTHAFGPIIEPYAKK
jgi:hypothetical protein